MEDRTAFGRWFSPGIFPLPSEQQSAAMYGAAVERLGLAGFEHYEISNYARPGRRSRHNQQYWRCEPVFGFGLGAASFVAGQRATRPSGMGQYAEWVEGAEQGGYSRAVRGLAQAQGGQGGQQEDMLDEIMLALRTADGLDLGRLRARHGALGSSGADKVLRAAKALAGRGLVHVLRRPPPECGASYVRLADPEGFLLSNDVISSIFAEF